MDPLTIGGTLSSLKTAADIAKTLMGLRDESQIRSKVIDLQSTIIAAQTAALESQTEQSQLLRRVRELESQIATLEAKLASANQGQKIPEARICPTCGGELKVTAEHPDPTFHFAGVKVHDMECAKCHSKTTRQFQPAKGYM
ncbi:MAG: hypothetical protein ABSD74_03395 [Rhizomicrobium sp.]